MGNLALGVLGALAANEDGWDTENARKIIDGDDGTCGYSVGWKWINDGAQWRINLGQPRTIDHVRLKQNPGAGWATHAHLEHSVDGTTWVMHTGLDFSSPDETLAITPIERQYWRFTSVTPNQGGATQWHMYTIELQGFGGISIPTGDARPLPPEAADCSGIAAWLTGLETYYVPCVEDWLEGQG